MKIKIPVALVVDVEVDIDTPCVWEWTALAAAGEAAPGALMSGLDAMKGACPDLWGDLIELSGRLVERGYEARVWPVAMRCGEALLKVEA